MARSVIFLFLAIFCLVQPAAAGILARSAILANLQSGATLYQRNADAQIPPASLTKIMTMFMALDAVKTKKLRLHQKIPVSATAARVGGSVMRLDAGANAPVVRLLAGMAVASGNDAATAIAEKLGGNVQKFVAMMNSRARKLGMSRTRFKNPTGLPAAGHKSTARDLMRLCRAYLAAHPTALRFHSMTYFMHKGQAFRNTNALLNRVPGVNGLKTGWTVASGYNLIATAKRGKTRLIAIVLGCPSKTARDAAATRLLEAGFKYPANPAQARKLIEH